MIRKTQLGTLTLLFGVVISFVALGSGVSARKSRHDLPSWNDTPTKKALLEFVSAVTNEKSGSYVEPEDRIAVFDNDGTLWVEKPIYTHFAAVFHRMAAQLKADPSLTKRQPYKAFAEKDKEYFAELYEQSAFETLLSQLIGVPFGGMTADAYADWVRRWLSKWKHPRFKVGVQGLVYQPMVELVHYLGRNGFAVYIFTADEGAFLRLMAEELYGLPPNRVHGSSVRSEYIADDDKAQLVRTYHADYLDNWDGKPRLIEKVVGKRPILAAGNSNGDLQMLQYTALG